MTLAICGTEMIHRGLFETSWENPHVPPEGDHMLVPSYSQALASPSFLCPTTSTRISGKIKMWTYLVK